jgi:cob(I)alamin adenosyltransferase
MAFKIYTKTGDSGETSLFGGKRLLKSHIRIEAYGTIDELNSHTGLLRDLLHAEDMKMDLLEIQDRLFTIGSHLATSPEKKMNLPQFSPEDVLYLENAIDRMDAQLEPLKTFILPGGHIAVSQAHVCRCVCRRGERAIVHLQTEELVDPLIVTYINRLSDYFFTLARYISKIEEAIEIPWVPKKHN